MGVRKFETLTEGILEGAEIKRFIELTQRLPQLSAADLVNLLPVLPAGKLTHGARDTRGIF